MDDRLQLLHCLIQTRFFQDWRPGDLLEAQTHVISNHWPLSGAPSSCEDLDRRSFRVSTRSEGEQQSKIWKERKNRSTYCTCTSRRGYK